jgi:hypothetical protein
MGQKSEIPTACFYALHSSDLAGLLGMANSSWGECEEITFTDRVNQGNDSVME